MDRIHAPAVEATHGDHIHILERQAIDIAGDTMRDAWHHPHPVRMCVRVGMEMRVGMSGVVAEVSIVAVHGVVPVPTGPGAVVWITVVAGMRRPREATVNHVDRIVAGMLVRGGGIASVSVPIDSITIIVVATSTASRV
jgi:hypothetical protein